MKSVISVGLKVGALVVAGAAGAGIYTCCMKAEAPTPAPVVATAAPAATTAEEKKPWRGPEGSEVPPSEAVEGAPWLKKMPGVKYSKPKKVPELLYKKYSSFEDSVELAKQGSGEVVGSKGDYKVNWLDPNSQLFTRIGIRAGDKVIAVNGQPAGKSAAAGQAMFESMKNQKHFSVLIERDGKQLVLTYSVGDE
jgi:hypothetical protein